MLGPTPSTCPLPERPLPFEGSSVAWSFSFPLFSPSSLPCPGLRIPDSSQGPMVPRPPLRSGSARPKLPSRHPTGQMPITGSFGRPPLLTRSPDRMGNFLASQVPSRADWVTLPRKSSQSRTSGKNQSSRERSSGYMGPSAFSLEGEGRGNTLLLWEYLLQPGRKPKSPFVTSAQQ